MKGEVARSIGKAEGGYVKEAPKDMRRSADPDVDVAAFDPCYGTASKLGTAVSLLDDPKASYNLVSTPERSPWRP